MEHLRDKQGVKEQTSLDNAIASHLMAFAAEESRLTGKVIDMETFTQNHLANLA